MRLIYTSLFMWALATAQAQITLVVTQVPATTPAGATIYAAGNFNGWNPGATPMTSLPNGDWTYTVPAGSGTLEYKFTRGSWATVEGTTQGAFRPNRTYVYGNGDTVRVQIDGWEGLSGGNTTANDHVQVYQTAFYMPQLGTTRRIWVYLPGGYASSTTRYPVLYMHDGQNVFDAYTSFSGEWEVDETLTRLEAAGDPGIIVVAIDNGGGSRLDEYSPWVNIQYGGGDGEAYVDFIAQTLKPHIDSVFRTLPAREHTGIMGSSMGGLISLYAMLRYPGVFSKGGILSPSFWFSDSVYTYAGSAPYQAPARAYLLAGGQEPASVAANNTRMRDTLSANGFQPADLRLRVVADGQHSEWFWKREFEDAYLFLYQNPSTAVSEPLAGVHVYPNPVGTSLEVQVPVVAAMTLYDAAGRVWMQDTLSAGQTQVRLPELPAGIYTIRLQAGNRVYTTRLMRE
ncbi:MAG: alpha/beta hydrolase-fold protein [Bacteroidia bacterium]|nr:alpha/beta hydrolase-fold protein [Bacteroidia bacterium]